MIPTKRSPTHSGEILKRMYLEPRNVSISELECATGISRKHLSQIINGKARVSAQTATKLAAAFDTTPELWVNAL